MKNDLSPADARAFFDARSNRIQAIGCKRGLMGAWFTKDVVSYVE